MNSICGANCDDCTFGKSNGCMGCEKSNGCPFGKPCFVAEYIKLGGRENFDLFVKNLIDEINALNIAQIPKIETLVPLNGRFVNLEYTLPNGSKVKFLDDNDIYLGTQVENQFGDDNTASCFGIVANAEFILVSEYGASGSNPQLVAFVNR